MTRHFPLRVGSLLVLGLCLGVAGCARAPAVAPAAAPTPVPVSYPVEQYVTDYADFTARIAAVDSVEVRAHVTGYLDKVNFTEGALVRKGDVLYEIDPREYQAQLDANQARVAQNEAALQLARANSQRFRTLFHKNPGAVSQQDLDRYQAEEAQNLANLNLAKANLGSARLNLEWTRVIAPVTGRVSRTLVTVGNLVQSGSTLLTTIVSVDPVYAYFDVDELTVQRVRRWLVREGKLKSDRANEVPVALGLAAEEGFPHQGTINFVDNQVNPKTGTLRARGVFRNRDEALSPGFFARVRVPVGPSHRALLVHDRALDNDQGQKVLYVVNDKNEVVSRPVRTGALHDGLREVTDGLKPGERVIVNGLQQVRPGVTVEPKLGEMTGRMRNDGMTNDERSPKPERPRPGTRAPDGLRTGCGSSFGFRASFVIRHSVIATREEASC
jgi:RND family efflux transporter MFP subunit